MIVDLPAPPQFKEGLISLMKSKRAVRLTGLA